jgi:hypothetical protein
LALPLNGARSAQVNPEAFGSLITSGLLGRAVDPRYQPRPYGFGLALCFRTCRPPDCRTLADLSVLILKAVVDNEESDTPRMRLGSILWREGNYL